MTSESFQGRAWYYSYSTSYRSRGLLRLILCWYYSSREAGQPQQSPARFLQGLGLAVAGATAALGTEVVWADKSDADATRGGTS